MHQSCRCHASGLDLALTECRFPLHKAWIELGHEIGFIMSQMELFSSSCKLKCMGFMYILVTVEISINGLIKMVNDYDL